MGHTISLALSYFYINFKEVFITLMSPHKPLTYKVNKDFILPGYSAKFRLYILCKVALLIKIYT